MATLTNTKIKDTYDGLLKTTDNEALDVSGVTLIEDGLGNASALSVGRSGNGVSVSGNLAVDTNTLYVDAANNRVGIGESNPDTKLEIKSTSSGGAALKLSFDTTPSGTVTTNDVLGQILFEGLDASGGGSVSGVYGKISSIANGLWDGSGVGADLSFSTGIYNGSSVVLSEKMRIDSSGNVGIGTSTVVGGSKLHISSANGTAYTSNAQLRISGANTNNNRAQILFSDDALSDGKLSYYPAAGTGAYFSLSARNTESDFILNASGNVGIGASDITSVGQYKVLELNGAGGSGGYLRLGSSDVEQGYIASDSNGLLYDASAGDNHIFYVSGSERMRIDSSGKVLIGTSSASGVDIFRVNKDGTDNYSTVNITNANSTAVLYVGVGGSNVGDTKLRNNAYLLNTGNSDMLFGTNAQERMRITSGGDVLISKQSSDYTTEGIELRDNGQLNVSCSSDQFNYYNPTAAAYRFYVSSTGTIYATNTTISSISDARLKDNIQDLTGGLDAVLSLRPRTYDWKEGSGQVGTGVRGFIAQEVEEVFPEYVDEYKTEELPEDGIPYKSVRQDFIPILVKAIQEQQEIINDLKARIETLEAK